MGIKILDYLLEKSRVVTSLPDERNFHIFYYLLAGASTEERAAFELGDASSFKYLNSAKFKTTYPEDAAQMSQLRESLKILGFGRRQQFQMYQLLAAILHLGNIEFVDDPNKPHEPCSIKNLDVLATAAELLGVLAPNLEITLTYQTKLIRNETCTIYLNAKEAANQRDDLCMTLYSLTFKWIIETINDKFCQDDCDNFIGIIDFPGFQDHTKNTFETLLYNYSAEKLQQFVNSEVIDKTYQDLSDAGFQVEKTSYERHDALLKAIEDRYNEQSLFELIDAEAGRSSSKAESKLISGISKAYGPNHPLLKILSSRKEPTLQVRHYLGTVEYDLSGFSERNSEMLSPDFVTLARGDARDMPASDNMFLQYLFSDSLIATQKHTADQRIVVNALESAAPMRKPSMRRKQSEPRAQKSRVSTWTRSYQTSLDELLATLCDTQNWFVLCVKPTNDASDTRFDSRKGKVQLLAHKVAEISHAKLGHDYTTSMTFDKFCERYTDIIEPMNIRETSPAKVVREFMALSNWNERQIGFGTQKVFLSEYAWRSLEDERQHIESERRMRAELDQKIQGVDTNRTSVHGRPLSMDSSSLYSSDEAGDLHSDTESTYRFEFVDQQGVPPPEVSNSNNFIQSQELTTGSNTLLPKEKKKKEKKAKKKLTAKRCKWLCLTWMLTWYVPSFCLKCCGLKRGDVRMAWREKLALCIIIFLMCCVFLFTIIVLGQLICPKQNVYSTYELSSRTTMDDPWLYAYGRAYQVKDLISSHLKSYGVQRYAWDGVLGKDSSDLFFKVPLWSTYCPNIQEPESSWDNIIKRRAESSWNNIYYHRNTIPSNGNLVYIRYLEYMNQYTRGRIAHKIEDLLKNANQKVVVLYNNVYDITSYDNSQIKFLGPEMSKLFDNFIAKDGTEAFKRLMASDPARYQAVLQCMNSMFYIGVIDTRGSAQCVLSNYILLSASVVIAAVILIKFVTALRFGSGDEPEEHDKFVICQVPCYTEGPDGLAKTLDSLALLRYDDKRKLLVVVCDGNSIFIIILTKLILRYDYR